MSLYKSTPALDASIKDILNGKKEVSEADDKQAIDMGDKEFKLKSAELKFKVKKHNDDRWDRNLERLKKRVRDDSSARVEEGKDTPGNSYSHQCAIHVKSEQFGEGKTLFSQHRLIGLHHIALNRTESDRIVCFLNVPEFDMYLDTYRIVLY